MITYYTTAVGDPYIPAEIGIAGIGRGIYSIVMQIDGNVLGLECIVDIGRSPSKHTAACCRIGKIQWQG